MKRIQLERRDRKVLVREDAENVFPLAFAPGDFSKDAGAVCLAGAVDEAVSHLNRTGERVAYVVIRIER